MSTTIFNQISSALIGADSTKRTVLADIKVSTSKGNYNNILPLIAISELSHQSRQQVDCALDGTIHVLSAAGGLATCQMTFMDRLTVCSAPGVRNTINGDDRSALRTYKKLTEDLKGSHIEVAILAENGTDNLAKFVGVVKSCTVTAQNKGGIDTLLVTYIMQGVME